MQKSHFASSRASAVLPSSVLYLMQCKKRFGDRDGDFVIGVRNDSPVTLDHTQLAGRGGGQIQIRISGLRQRRQQRQVR